VRHRLARRYRERMAKAKDKDEALKRLGGGRWQTRDERFTIEPQSGTWVVLDAEQTDDLGLPRVRGPFGSLRDAKEAIEAARGTEPSASPLAARIEELNDRPATRSDTDERRPKRAKGAPAASPPKVPDAPEADGTPPDERSGRAEPGRRSAKVVEPAEPRWMRDLDPDERRRARRLLDRLTDAGAPDPEGTVRRDIVGQVPAAAGYAVGRAILALGPDAAPGSVASVLADGRDDELGVRWRLVDGAGRPITIDPRALDIR
jgi:hypothetical protein